MLVTDLPKISIITTSNNQAETLEQTIRSVFDQEYPNLEYFVVDSGSTDGSVEIIQKYAERFKWWCSQRDNGTAQAINKGLDKTTGDIIGYLDGKDYYTPDALWKVGEFVRDHPQTDFLYGRCRLVDEQGELLREHQANIFTIEELLDLWNVWWKQRQLIQPECFWSRRVLLKARGFQEKLAHAFDYEYWTRLFQAGAKVERLPEALACFRIQPHRTADSGTVSRELLKIVGRLLWKKKVKLDRSFRKRLQADWLYETVIRPAVRESEKINENRWQRRLRLAKIVAVHPKVIRSERFREQFRKVKPEAADSGQETDSL